jgi:hypothetical protein
LIRSRDPVTGAALASPREVRLRRIAGEVDGLASLANELAEMPASAPIGRAVLDQADPNPRPGTAGPIPANVLASTAKQLGLTVEELTEHDNLLRGQIRNEGSN